MSDLFIISAPSGAGKTSLIKALIKNVNNITVSISMTTRKKRLNEVNGENYHFIGDKQFQQLVQNNQFLEYATVFNEQYGTPKQPIINLLTQNEDVILEIDWQGAKQAKQNYPQATSIFILPPSLTALKERLLKRSQDSIDTINYRLQNAKLEIKQLYDFDYLITNHKFEQALSDLTQIILSKRFSQQRQTKKHQTLINKLLINHV